jgi:multicomponent Na+:H+ antiporter subunit D
MRAVRALYLVGALSLAGIPPLNGFISKLALVQGGISAQSWLVLGLCIGAGLITLLYMVRTWQHIFQATPAESLKLKPVGDSIVAPALLIGLCVLLGIAALPLVEAASLAVSRLGDPNLYIRSILGG